MGNGLFVQIESSTNLYQCNLSSSYIKYILKIFTSGIHSVCLHSKYNSKTHSSLHPLGVFHRQKDCSDVDSLICLGTDKIYIGQDSIKLMCLFPLFTSQISWNRGDLKKMFLCDLSDKGRVQYKPYF